MRLGVSQCLYHVSLRKIHSPILVERGGLTTELTTAQETIERLEAQAAEAAAALAAAQAVAATQAAAVAAQPPAAPPVVPKPRGAIRGLEALSGLSHLDYKAVQVCHYSLTSHIPDD